MPMTIEQIEAQLKRLATRQVATIHVLASVVADLAGSQDQDAFLGRLATEIDHRIDQYPQLETLGIQVSEDVRLDAEKILGVVRNTLESRRR